MLIFGEIAMQIFYIIISENYKLRKNLVHKIYEQQALSTIKFLTKRLYP